MYTNYASSRKSKYLVHLNKKSTHLLQIKFHFWGNLKVREFFNGPHYFLCQHIDNIPDILVCKQGWLRKKTVTRHFTESHFTESVVRDTNAPFYLSQITYARKTQSNNIIFTNL